MGHSTKYRRVFRATFGTPYLADKRSELRSETAVDPDGELRNHRKGTAFFKTAVLCSSLSKAAVQEVQSKSACLVLAVSPLDALQLACCDGPDHLGSLARWKRRRHRQRVKAQQKGGAFRTAVFQKFRARARVCRGQFEHLGASRRIGLWLFVWCKCVGGRTEQPPCVSAVAQTKHGSSYL